jgi:hypothetical protein
MLCPMDVAATDPGAGAAPWIVLGAVLGIALVTLAALVAAVLVRARRPGAGPEVGEPDDDLPGFHEAPPGFPGARRPPADGWVSLALPPPAAGTPAPDRPSMLLAGLAGGVLLLVGLAALVAGLGRGEAASRTPPSGVASGHGTAGDVDARVTFEGLILERRAVGVTVTAPTLELTVSGGTARASVTLPAWNCLADEAPADPEAADCAETQTEYADLATPALDAVRDGEALRVSGRFATVTHPNGGPPEPTGRVYALSFTVTPAGPDGAAGEVRLGDDRATAVAEPGVNVLRRSR